MKSVCLIRFLDWNDIRKAQVYLMGGSVTRSGEWASLALKRLRARRAGGCWCICIEGTCRGRRCVSLHRYIATLPFEKINRWSKQCIADGGRGRRGARDARPSRRYVTRPRDTVGKQQCALTEYVHRAGRSPVTGHRAVAHCRARTTTTLSTSSWSDAAFIVPHTIQGPVRIPNQCDRYLNSIWEP